MRKTSEVGEKQKEEVGAKARAIVNDLNNRPRTDSMTKVLKHPVAIITMVAAGAYVALYGASFMLDALTRANTSLRKFRLSQQG